jgi:hypothetical protein
MMAEMMGAKLSKKELQMRAFSSPPYSSLQIDLHTALASVQTQADCKARGSQEVKR